MLQHFAGKLFDYHMPHKCYCYIILTFVIIMEFNICQYCFIIIYVNYECFPVCEKTQENEAVKVIRVKEGMLKLSESYLDVAYKANIIFDGTRSIASGLPVVDQTRNVQDIRYRGELRNLPYSDLK